MDIYLLSILPLLHIHQFQFPNLISLAKFFFQCRAKFVLAAASKIKDNEITLGLYLKLRNQRRKEAHGPVGEWPLK